MKILAGFVGGFLITILLALAFALVLIMIVIIVEKITSLRRKK